MRPEERFRSLVTAADALLAAIDDWSDLESEKRIIRAADDLTDARDAWKANGK
jgi:hypothetical protein